MAPGSGERPAAAGRWALGGPVARGQTETEMGDHGSAREDTPILETGRSSLEARLRAWRPEIEGIVATHISVLGFTPDRVYKTKRPVAFPFVDLSTVERRRVVCNDEVRLNRRLAPDVYLGVDDLPATPDLPAEPVVVMRRLPDARRLSELVAAGAGSECLDALADRIAAFHAVARRGPEVDACATHAFVHDLWERGFDGWSAFRGNPLDEDAVAEVEARARAYLAGRAPLFAARVAAGRAVDGHGDLLTQDVFCLDDGPRVLDCLEFSDELRFGDVLADLAFVAMDLERRDAPMLARRFLDRARLAEGDDWPASLEHHWIAYRAHVRAKVACLRHADGADPEAVVHAAADLELARRHLAAGTVHLVAIGGLPASGKSTIAAAYAAESGSVLVRSDVVRKARLGLAADADASAPIDTGLYTPRARAAVYDDLLREAARHAHLGVSVVLDASWSEPAARAALVRLGLECSAPVVAFECQVADDVARARIAGRAACGGDASDAGPDVLAAMRARWEPWVGAHPLATDAPVVDLVTLLAAVVRDADS